MVQNEVDAWVNGGLVNQTTCAEMNNRIQHVITLFMTKSMELSDLEMKENKNDLFETTSATSNNSTIPITSHARDEVQETSIICRDKTVHLSDLDASFITTTKFAILEEAVFSLKKTTEQIQERQVNFDEKLEILTKANLKSKKKFQERLTELEKSNKEMYSNIDELFETATYVDDKFKKFEDENKKLQERLTALEKRNQELCSNVDDFFETLSNVDVKLNRLEEENKYVHVSMNKLNEQISFVKTCSNDALLSIQDLSKSVESTNQHYNEMSNKMDQLEISINVLSSKYTEQLENMERINEDKVDGLIGMVCQLISKRLAPLETLNETLKKKFILSNEHISKLDANDTQLAEISGKVTQIESIFNQPTLLFNACKILKMAVTPKHTQRFVQFVNQQLDVLKEEKRTLEGTADDFIHQVQKEVDAWVNEGQANHSTFEEITSRIQQAITFFITKSVEFSAISLREKASQSMPNRMVKIEEAVASLKANTKKTREHQGRVDRKLKEMSTQQEQNTKEIANLKDESKELKETNLGKCIDLEKEIQDNNSKFGLVCQILAKRLTPLEELREQLNTSLNTRKELTKKVDIMKSQVETMKNQIDVTKSKTDCLEGQIDVIFLSVDNTNRQVANMNVETDTMKEQIQNMKSKIFTLESEVSSIKIQAENFEGRDDSTESQGDGIENDVASTVWEGGEMESPLHTITSKVGSLESMVYTLGDQMNEIMSQRETMEIQIAAVKSQANTMDNNMNLIRLSESLWKTKMERQINTIKSQEDAMERQINEIKSQEDANSIAIESYIKWLRFQAKTVNRQIKTTKSQITKVRKVVTQIETKCNRPNVGFFALKTLNLPAGCDDVTMFDVVDNFGSHFDLSTGQFTAPLDGFYLISISASCQSNALFSLRCFQKTNECLGREYDHRYLCAVYENRSITRGIELMEGEVIYLKSVSSDATQNNLIVIQFSCCMIKG